MSHDDAAFLSDMRIVVEPDEPALDLIATMYRLQEENRHLKVISESYKTLWMEADRRVYLAAVSRNWRTVAIVSLPSFVGVVGYAIWLCWRMV